MKTLISALLIAIPLLLSAKTEYQYIDIKGDQIQLGTYKGDLSVKSDKLNLDLNNYSYSEIAEYLDIQEGDNVLLYFHSLFGGVNVYHKDSVKKLKEIEGMDKVISIVWHTEGLNYVNSWEEAISTSELYKPVVGKILENESINKFVLCHSMGHRIFEGIVCDYESSAIHINTIVFTGTDLDLDVFDKSLSTLPSLTDQLYLYVHPNDRLLKKSKKSHKKERMGLDGLTRNYGLELIDNLERIDVTNSSGSKTIRLTNHIYFKRDKKVLADINNVINGNETAREKYLFEGKNQIRILK